MKLLSNRAKVSKAMSKTAEDIAVNDSEGAASLDKAFDRNDESSRGNKYKILREKMNNVKLLLP